MHVYDPVVDAATILGVFPTVTVERSVVTACDRAHLIVVCTEVSTQKNPQRAAHTTFVLLHANADTRFSSSRAQWPEFKDADWEHIYGHVYKVHAMHFD